MLLMFIAVVGAGNGTALGRVSVIRLCDGSPSLQQLASDIRRDLTQRGWRVKADLEHTVPRPCPARSDDLRDSLEEGRQLFQRLDLEEAQAQLEGVVVAAIGRAADPGAIDILMEARFYLGWLHFETGRTVRSRQYFRALLTLRPAWVPDPKEFPPSVLAVFKEEKAALDQTPRRPVGVATQPVGSRVTLDGLHTCTSPCRLKEVLAGEHVLVVEKPGYTTVVKRFRSEGRGRKLMVRLQRDERAQVAALLGQGDRVKLEGLASRLGSAVLVLIDDQGHGRNVVHVLRFAPTPESERIELSPLRVARAASRVAELVGQPAMSPVAVQTKQDQFHGDAPFGDQTAITDQWWFWPAVGVVAYGIAVGVMVVAPSDSLTIRP